MLSYNNLMKVLPSVYSLQLPILSSLTFNLHQTPHDYEMYDCHWSSGFDTENVIRRFLDLVPF